MPTTQADTTRGSDQKAAILVMERGSLWPGPTLDWADHVTVVLEPTKRNANSMLHRVRRAADARAMRLRSLECVTVTFADVASPSSSRYRVDLIRGLGALLVDVGCRRLVLAAYHIERLELAELMALVDVPPRQAAEPLLVQVCFQRASHPDARRASTRH